MLLDLGAEHNAEEKGEDEAVSENLNDVVVELEDKIDKEKDKKVFVIESEPKAELEADLDSQEGTPLNSLETWLMMMGIHPQVQRAWGRPAIHNILLPSCKYDVVTSVFGDKETYSNTLL